MSKYWKMLHFQIPLQVLENLRLLLANLKILRFQIPLQVLEKLHLCLVHN